MPRPIQLWVFRARLERVVDGDTVDVTIDMGRRVYAVERLRFLGINCPEIHGSTHVEGEASEVFTIDWIQAATLHDPRWPLTIQTEKDDTFGRYLATVWRTSDDRSLNEDLLSSGMAVPFHLKLP